MDERRLADVRAGHGDTVARSGSGYLVSPALVLTARHVVAEDRRPWPRVQVHIWHPAHGSPALTDGHVCWQHPAEDLALVRISQPVAVPGAPVRWGRAVGTSDLRYTGLGFPKSAEYQDKRRFAEPLAGQFNPLSLDPDGYALNSDSAPDEGSDAALWIGVSGAAVFAGGLLTGVVTRDDRRFAGRRLRAAPVHTCISDPEFARLVSADAGVPPRVEPVELADFLDARMAKAPARTPGSLLAATAEAVDFYGRDEVLARLAAWRDDPAPLFSILLITGEGGQGKTRLGREFARTSGLAGWTAGFFRKPVQIQDADQYIKRAENLAQRLSSSSLPAVIVCDYAETHPVFTDTITAKLIESPPRHPVRLLLLSRTTGAWWDGLAELLGDAAATVPLAPLGSGDDARREIYLRAVTSLAPCLAELPATAVGGPAPPPWTELANRLTAHPPVLPAGAANVLTLQMVALLDLLQAAAGTAAADDAPERQLAAHERDYLKRVAAAQHLLDEDALSMATDTHERERQALAVLDRALAGLILLGPCTADMARAIGRLSHPGQASNITHWLATLYPPQGQELSLGQVQPDRLGEFLLGAILTATGRHGEHVHADLLTKVGALVTDPDAARSMLFVLVRTAAHLPFASWVAEQTADLIAAQPDPFAAAAPALATTPDHRTILMDGLHRLADRDPAALSSQAARASNGLPRSSISLASFIADVTGTVTELFRTLAERDRVTYLPRLAQSLANHALRLAEVGQIAAALPLSSEAVALNRELTALSRVDHLPELAMALFNHASRLAETGQVADALAASSEAVGLYQELVARDRGIYLSYLAAAFSNHALRLAEAGKRDEALDISERAIAAREEQAAFTHEPFDPELAASLANHAIRLVQAGRQLDAIPLSERAVALRRKLATLNRDAYLPDQALSLLNHANLLAETGRLAEALPLSTEAVKLFRELADLNRDAYLPHLALSLLNRASHLTAATQFTEALVTSTETVALHRELTGRQPNAHLPNLASALNGHASLMSATGRHTEALTVAEEALAFWRRLADLNPDAHLPKLAAILVIHTSMLSGAGRHADALVVSAEAVDLYREFLARNHAAYLVGFVHSLVARGTALKQSARYGEATVVLTEARKLAPALPAHFSAVPAEIDNLLRQMPATAELSFAQALAGGEVTLHVEELSRTITVRIPPGVRDGQRIRLSGAGLYVTIRVRPHEVFGRRGDDVTVTVPVAYAEMTDGADIQIPAPSGAPVTIRIPTGMPASRVLRVSGYGVRRPGGTAGHLLVSVDVLSDDEDASGRRAGLIAKCAPSNPPGPAGG
jgi:tetratricopeptide (TPR) repeat protein